MRSSSSMRRRPANVGSTAGSSQAQQRPLERRGTPVRRHVFDVRASSASGQGRGRLPACRARAGRRPRRPAARRLPRADRPGGPAPPRARRAVRRRGRHGHRAAAALRAPRPLGRRHAQRAGPVRRRASTGVDAPVYVVSKAVLAADRRLRPPPRRHRRRRPPAAAVDRRRRRAAPGASPCSRGSTIPRTSAPSPARPGRSASTRLVLDPTCIDPYYRRTVRVSMGEVLYLPVARAATLARRPRRARRRRRRDVGADAGSGGRADLVARRPAAGRAAARRRGSRAVGGRAGRGPTAGCASRSPPTSTRSTSATPRPWPSPPCPGSTEVSGVSCRARRGRLRRYCGTPAPGRNVVSARRRPAGPWPAPSSWPSPWPRPRGP